MPGSRAQRGSSASYKSSSLNGNEERKVGDVEEGLLTVPLLAGLQKDNEGDRDGDSEDGPTFTKPEAPSPFLDLFFFAEKVRGARSSFHAKT